MASVEETVQSHGKCVDRNETRVSRYSFGGVQLMAGAGWNSCTLPVIRKSRVDIPGGMDQGETRKWEES